MKFCPQCGNRYSDHTLRFCLQDGMTLSVERVDEMPTAVLREIETADAIGRTDRSVTPRRSNTAVAVLVTVITMLVLFGIVGTAAFLYLNRDAPSYVSNAGPQNAANTAVTSTASPTPRGSPSQTPTPQSTPALVDADLRDEIIDELDNWKSASEDLDLESHLDQYAPTVDYYNKSGASRDYIRRDKERAFARFSSIRLTLSDISVVGSGAAVTATFDKEWEFSGKRKSTGKVQQLVRMSRIGGRWLITAEKDLKVYYKR